MTNNIKKPVCPKCGKVDWYTSRGQCMECGCFMEKEIKDYEEKIATLEKSEPNTNLIETEEQENTSSTKDCDDDCSVCETPECLKDSNPELDEEVEVADPEQEKSNDDEEAEEPHTIGLNRHPHAEYEEEPTIIHVNEYQLSKFNQENSNEHSEICKIKYDKKSGCVDVSYEVQSEKHIKDVVFKGKDQITEDFYYTIQKMVKELIEVLSLPEEWEGEITITGLSINRKDKELMGMVITAQKEIPGLNAPLNLNSPFIKFKSYCEMIEIDEDITYSRNAETWLSNIFKHADRYMQGESKNTQLPLINEY